MLDMLLNNPDALAATAWGLVVVLTPVVIALVRRWRPEFEVSSAQKKMAAAILVAFAGGYATTPGEWQERLAGGIVAVLASQGLYNVVRVRNKPKQHPLDFDGID